MIGQEGLIHNLSEQLKDGNLPSFIILSGNKGCGKKLLVNEMFPNVIPIEPKVDSIREMIVMANKMSHRTFLIADASGMSQAAQNAMLKVVEECPNYNRFIITVENANDVLTTIRSRGTVFEFEPYTAEQLKQYLRKCNGVTTPNELNITADVCETMGDIELLNSYGITEFYEYVEKVVDNIAVVSGANAFKIGDKINFKDDDSKYDLKLFLSAFRRVCGIRYTNTHEDDKNAFLTGIITCTKYLSELRIKGINKQSLFDMWLLDIRKDWMSYGDS